MYHAENPPAPSVRPEDRISRLERDLAKLEGIVETLVNGIASEHQAMRENMNQSRQALKELGDKMENSVTRLAAEIKALAEKSAQIDSQVLAKQSQATGAVSFARWLLATMVALASLGIAYQSGRQQDAVTPREPAPVTRSAS